MKVKDLAPAVDLLPYPAATDDVYAALTWLAGSVDELDVDVERIAIGGGSAGAGLAARVALPARDRGGPASCRACG